MEVTIFNESITEKALKEFQEQADWVPKVIENKDDYNVVYAHYQESRKLRIAIKKKTEELVKSAKSSFDAEKRLILNEENKILSIITPIEARLKLTRQTWEESERLKAEKKASEIAEKQKAEFNRQEILRVWEQAHLENYDYVQKILADIERAKKDDELKEREIQINKREKELELIEKERREELIKELTKISTEKRVEMGIPTREEFIKKFVPLDKQEDPITGVLPAKPEENEPEESELNPFLDVVVCPNCDFKFNTEEGE